MSRRFRHAFFITFLVFTSILAQTPVSPVKPPQAISEDDVVRITANLVQLDVTVTDRNGRQVTDLKPEDFEIREEGRAQEITNFSYVEVSPERSLPVAVKVSDGTPRIPPPPASSRVRADQVRRTMAVLVDDVYMSFGSVGAVRDTLKKFVAEQIEPGDLVGFFRTNGGNRMLQQFTIDQNQLAFAVRRLVWEPTAENSIDPFENARGDFDQEGRVATRLQTQDPKSPRSARAAYFDYVPDDPIVIPTLRFLINDMRKLPGRKSIILFSDKLSVTTRTLMLLRFLTDYANRSGVVIYVVDARGLVNLEYVEPEKMSPPSDEARRFKNQGFFKSQNGLNYLAEKTGGTFAHNNNDLGKGIRNALEERRGYYLVGYRPSEDTFKDGVRGFRKIEVKLKRPGLRVRTRDGFIGISDDVLEVPKRPATANTPLYQVLASPLAATDIPVRLTPVFGQTASGTSFLRALVHLDTQAIKLIDEPNGWKGLKLHVAGVTFGQDGRVVDEFTRTHTIHIPPEALALVRENGLVYSADTPVKTPGAYQFRIVVRDTESNKFGSASQFIEIPDLKKGLLTLSSIVLAQSDSNVPHGLPPATPAEAALSLVPSSGNPAVRRFRPGTELSFAYLIQNAQISAKRKPQITTQVRLFHQGREVFAGPESVLDAGQQTGTERLSNDGLLRLNPDWTTGDYILQIIVKDQLAGKKARVATQWIDFQIIES